MDTSATSVLHGGRVFIDGALVDDVALIIRDGLVRDVVPDSVQASIGGQRIDLNGLTLAPGLIDVQVNGGGGVLLNDSPDVATIKAIANAHRPFGTTGLLPTLISDDLEVVQKALVAVQQAVDLGVTGILGLHIEGPFLNATRKGIHDADRLRRLTRDLAESLTPLRGGKVMLTVAPEMTDPGTIEYLAERGFVVCAGHTQATYDQIRQAEQHGLRGFTHLFNAMSQMTAREPGVVGAALDSRTSWSGIIVDGHHVAPASLRVAARAVDRLMLVSDAMPCVGSSATSFQLQGRVISVDDGVCRDESGTLAGTNLNMIQAVRNAVAMMGVTLERALMMATSIPAHFLGLEGAIGRIGRGRRADLIAFDEDYSVHHSWVGGELMTCEVPADHISGRTAGAAT